MKNLLMKLFPNYFHICKHYEVKYEDFPTPNKPFKLVQVDEDNEDTLRVLGITHEREEFLEKEIKKAVIDNTCKIEVLNQMAPHIKHINEFYVVVLMIQRETAMGGGPLGGLIQAFMDSRKNGPQEGGE